MNKKNWHFYRTSEEGKKTVEIFDCFQPTSLEQIAVGIFCFQEHKQQQAIPLARYINNYYWLAEILDEKYNIEDVQDVDEFLAFIDDIDFLGNNREKLSWLPVLSIYLYISYGYYKPILFSHRYDYFLQLCANLGIEMPEMTRSRDYREYFRYYHQLCGALYKFQTENELSNEEMCACLYDYAATLGDDNAEPAELPQPTNIWLTGASKFDVEEISRKGLTETIWACNERTRRGDIIIIYALTPNSCLYAIGRAKTGGFFDPFDYYHCRAVFTDGQLLPRIPFKELKAHPYISQIPVFRQNLQGINGRELTPKDYAEIVALIRSHGYTEPLPELLNVADYEMPKVRVEKDVEEKILKPFLAKIGYVADEHYTQQLSQQFGRKEKGIPDFVFFPYEQIRHNYIAPFIIEAKFDMRNSSVLQREKDFAQAFSYAKGMKCALFALCDIDRFVLYTMPQSGAPDVNKPVFDDYWANIHTNAEVFMRLKKLIGKETIENIKVS